MKSPRLFVIGICAITCLASGRTSADQIIRLNGSSTDAAITTLKGSADANAEIVPVFHGRIAACLFGCRRPVVCCAPPPVYYGCVGGFGGPGYAIAPVAAHGYAARSYAAPVYSPLPSYAYRAPTPQYNPLPSRAIVSLPRLGLTFSFGDESGQLVGRSTFGNALSRPIAPMDDVPVLPPSERQADPFRYDGGPANPIPLPGSTRSMPQFDPRSAPALNNRVKLTLPKLTWQAYGDKPNAKPSASPNTLLVQQRVR